ncbi:MAG: hypothetical protein N2035_05105 [Chthoniobacterales bacterium]|nr:hypothetical protein [Chthoniobacterales bacterium]
MRFTSSTSLPPQKTPRVQTTPSLLSPPRQSFFLKTQRTFYPKTSWSRYEILSFQMFAWLWVALLAIVLTLHILNYHRETQTSSTSKTHTAFYGLPAKSPASASHPPEKQTDVANPSSTPPNPPTNLYPQTP